MAGTAHLHGFVFLLRNCILCSFSWVHESVVQAQGQVLGSAKEGDESGCRDFLDPDEARLPVPG